MEINLSIIQRVGAELNNNYVETLIMIWKLNHSFHFRTLPHIRWRPQPGDWDTNSERSFSTLWGNIVSIAVTSVLQFWHQCTWMFLKLWKVHTHAFYFYWKHIIQSPAFKIEKSLLSTIIGHLNKKQPYLQQYEN